MNKDHHGSFIKENSSLLWTISLPVLYKVDAFVQFLSFCWSHFLKPLDCSLEILPIIPVFSCYLLHIWGRGSNSTSVWGSDDYSQVGDSLVWLGEKMAFSRENTNSFLRWKFEVHLCLADIVFLVLAPSQELFKATE